jgi:hypothetical protein
MDNDSSPVEPPQVPPEQPSQGQRPFTNQSPGDPTPPQWPGYSPPGYAPPGYAPPGYMYAPWQYGAPPNPPKRPTVWPVVVWTLVIGIFGAIPAAIRFGRARASGFPAARYWGAFAATFGAWLIVIVTIAVAASRPVPSVMTTTQLDTDLVQSGDWKTALGTSATATSAICVTDHVAQNGAGTYRCVVDFTDGSRESILVTVDDSGTYVASPG